MNKRRHLRFLIFNTLLLGLLACMNAVAQVEVNSADPDLADQGTISLDVTIGGSGFDSSAAVKFLQAGTKKEGGVSVNSVHYRNAAELVVNIDVAVDAYVGSYDIEVRQSRGRRGKGSTLFAVAEKIHLTGEAASLNCELVTDEHDTNELGFDTVRNDGLGLYEDGTDKVACWHSGTLSTYGIQLKTAARGPAKKAIRKIDLAFGYCDGPDGSPCTTDVPDAFLDAAVDVVDMEDIWIGVGPYPGMAHISLLPQGNHELKFHMSPFGLADRFVVQLMNRDTFPPELGQGGWCNLDDHPVFSWADAKTTEDITVCIWPDDDGDTRPDGYTITTGDTDCLTTWPSVTPRERMATICSTAGPVQPCDGDLCNLLGTVPLQFTLHATYQ